MFIIRMVTASILAMAISCASSTQAPPAVAPTPPTAEAEAAPAPATCPDQSGLCLSIVPDDAQVEVDGETRGLVSALGVEGARFIALKPGIHRVTLRRDGMRTWRTEVTVGEAVEPINVTLQPN